jgi:hypothetical protein
MGCLPIASRPFLVGAFCILGQGGSSQELRFWLCRVVEKDMIRSAVENAPSVPGFINCPRFYAEGLRGPVLVNEERRAELGVRKIS